MNKEIRWYEVRPNKYNHTSYLMARIDGKTVYQHRLVAEEMLGRKLIKGEVVDHINGDGLDNRKENLRVCSPKQNISAQSPRKHSSRFRGVTFRKDIGRWEARIAPNRHKIHIGYFDDEKLAGLAYNREATKHFGEYAKLNEI